MYPTVYFTPLDDLMFKRMLLKESHRIGVESSIIRQYDASSGATGGGEIGRRT
jgi:hypothetical protein